MSLKTPFGPLLASFAALRGSAIIPRALAQERKDLGARAIGTGPFKLPRFVPHDHLHYVKNDKYWARALPHLHEPTFQVLVEGRARDPPLRARQIPDAYRTGAGPAR